MPRPTRLHVPGGFYHVTLRGNHREALFGHPADHAKLDELVADALERFEARLHAYCWMTNHLHALIQVGDAPLGRLVQSIAMRYARYRHTALQTSGHLFEPRHFARLIEFDAYFLAVLRYIHLNPVKAGLVTDPSEYSWSSHHAYASSKPMTWVTTEVGLSLFGDDTEQARHEYMRFISRSADHDETQLDVPIVREDPRVLGGRDFVDSLTLAPPPESAPPALEELVAKTCLAHGVSLESVRSQRARHLTVVRLEVLEAALKNGVATLSEVARYLHRDPSTLSKQLRRLRS